MEIIKCYGIEAVKEGNKWRTKLVLPSKIPKFPEFITRDLGYLDKITVEDGKVKSVRVLDNEVNIVGVLSCKVKDEKGWKEISCKIEGTDDRKRMSLRAE